MTACADEDPRDLEIARLRREMETRFLRGLLREETRRRADDPKPDRRSDEPGP